MTDRRDNTFRFDWTFNITNIIAIVGIILTIAHYGSNALEYLKQIDSRTNIMWVHFDKSQLTKEELSKLGLN